MNNNDQPRAPEVRKASWVHAMHTVVRMSSSLNCTFSRHSLVFHPITVSEFTGLTPNSFWPAEWPCASHMRFLQHIKNDPTFSFYTEVVHQDDYAQLKCNPEQEHLGTFPYMEGDRESTPPASCSSPKWHAEQEKEKQTKQKTPTYFRSDIKTNFFSSNT